MKLYIQPQGENAAALQAALGQQQADLCLPCDIGPDGRFGAGFVAVTQTRILVLFDGQLSAEYPLCDFVSFTARAMIGNGIFEGEKTDGSLQLIARCSMYQIPRFMQAGRIITRRLQDLPPPPDTNLEDRICPKCGRQLPRNSHICPHCIDRWRTVRRMLMIARPYWLPLMMSVVIMFVGNGLSMISPYIQRYIVDNYLAPPAGTVLPSNAVLLLALFFGMSFLVKVLQTGCNVLRGRMMVRLSARLASNLRNQVYAKLQEMSLRYMNARRTGDLMNRITGDTNRIRNFIEQQLPMMLNTVIMLVVLLIVLIRFNWMFALLVIVPMPISMMITRAMRRKMHRLYHLQWTYSDRANSLLQDILTGIRVVKAFGKESHEVNRFAQATKMMTDRQQTNEKLWNTVFPLTGFIMGLGNFLLLYYGSSLVLRGGSGGITIGEMLQYSTYAGMLYGPLNYLVMFPRWYTMTVTSAERVFEVLDEEPEIRDREVPKNDNLSGPVVFDNVTFGYEAYDPVLHEINLTVNPGEMIGLVGPSGSGKSTLTNLVLRLYDVQEGELTIGGVDIRDYAMSSLRQNIGVVLQENFLFSGTIFENIRYAKPDAGPEEVIRAAMIANAHDFITKFPDGYNTYVGENGHNLSGGERQRIAIARAILHNPRILILDEATASLDTETEKHIQEALQRLMQNRTVFAIAHRLSTLRNANRLVVLNCGRIVETGTHNELLKQKGMYYDLVMMQRRLGRMKGKEDT